MSQLVMCAAPTPTAISQAFVATSCFEDWPQTSIARLQQPRRSREGDIADARARGGVPTRKQRVRVMIMSNSSRLAVNHRDRRKAARPSSDGRVGVATRAALIVSLIKFFDGSSRISWGSAGDRNRESATVVTSARPVPMSLRSRILDYTPAPSPS